MSSESQPCSVDVPSYTVEQVEGITSEYIVKNAVSVSTGTSSPSGKAAAPLSGGGSLNKLTHEAGDSCVEVYVSSDSDS